MGRYGPDKYEVDVNLIMEDGTVTTVVHDITYGINGSKQNNGRATSPEEARRLAECYVRENPPRLAGKIRTVSAGEAEFVEHQPWRADTVQINTK